MGECQGYCYVDTLWQRSGGGQRASVGLCCTLFNGTLSTTRFTNTNTNMNICISNLDLRVRYSYKLLILKFMAMLDLTFLLVSTVQFSWFMWDLSNAWRNLYNIWLSDSDIVSESIIPQTFFQCSNLIDFSNLNCHWQISWLLCASVLFETNNLARILRDSA